MPITSVALNNDTNIQCLASIIIVKVTLAYHTHTVNDKSILNRCHCVHLDIANLTC